jgi:hypothetical protein
LSGQRRRGFGRLLPPKRPSGKACHGGKKLALAVDLFTEIRKPPQLLGCSGPSAHDECNSLFFHTIILFNYWAETAIALSDRNLGAWRGAYSQSYPQNLWVSSFRFCGKSLKAYAKTLSSIDGQASEPA